MVTGVTSPSDGDLSQLRQHYDRLCDLMTRTAETDPAAAEQVLGELRTLSERIVALEADDRDPARATEPWPADPLPGADAPEPSPSNPPPSRPAAAPTASQRRVTAAPQPGRRARIVSFRVAPVARKEAPVAPATATWRVDEPPEDPATASPSAPDAPWPAAPPPHPAAAPTQEAEPAPPAPEQPAAPPRGNATLFSSAIRQWLERHRQAGEADAPETTPPAPLPHPGNAEMPASDDRPPASAELARMEAAIEQQAEQIERILRLCEEHQAALERLETQTAERLQALQPPPSATPDPEPPVAELRLAVEEQRQRITALAKTIHNLAQWLAAQQAAPDR